MTFRFTKSADLNSSAVESAYYNDKTRELAVELVGGNTYKYDNVPAGAFATLTDPRQSAGRFYATSIKRNYGPGSSLGYAADFVQENTVSTVGTPKALTFDLGGRGALTQPKVDRFEVEVKFVVSGQSAVKTYKTKASTLDEALDNLNEATEALGIEVTVKEATVKFE